ncbi:DUF4249 family protein [Maribacter sp. 2210JD10-5]|uniref:DUF4249 family protein n=1 Tax=Maribacter sp. 2210JD10-5 TaxID=3386272 RepID=UPI0039BCFF31
MKKYLFLVTILFLGACEDVIDISLPTSPTRLVIDAVIGIDEIDGDITTVGQVRLTLTASFLDEEVLPAEGATVSITNLTTDEVFVLDESEPGTFNIGLPIFEFDTDYRLEVVHNGENYESIQQLARSGTINNVVQGDGFLLDQEKETEVIITFTDVPNERNYYLFAFGTDDFLTTDDEFYRNNVFTFSYFYENLNPGDLQLITLLGINKGFSRYASIVIQQSGVDGGGPFTNPPSSVRGNIINTSNPENYPLGYFALSEFDFVSITIE